jgi:putative ABC transport system permease protein
MPTAGVIDLSVWQVGLAAVLVGVVIVISARQALGLERDLVVGTVRTIVQLYFVGIILASVFAAGRWYLVVLVLIAMTLVRRSLA